METRGDQLFRIFKDFLAYVAETIEGCEGLELPKSFQNLAKLPCDAVLPHVIDEVKSFPDSDKPDDVIFALGSAYVAKDYTKDLATKLGLIKIWGDQVSKDDYTKNKLVVYVQFLKKLVKESQ